MIFPSLELENTVQVDDKTRLDGVKSFITPDEADITLVEIEPLSGSGFIDVTTNRFLDWQYVTDETVTVSIRITTDGAPTTITKDMIIISVVDDALFSSDSQLESHEPDILKYTENGRNSFLNVHRTAQIRILDWLDAQRIWDNDGNRMTKANIIDIEEFQQWSKYLTLQMVFEGLSNETDDIFQEKMTRYRTLAESPKNRGALRLDFNNDGEIDSTEKTNLKSLRLVRR